MFKKVGIKMEYCPEMGVIKCHGVGIQIFEELEALNGTHCF